MARHKRITIRGKPRIDLDPMVFLQVLLAIGEEWDSDNTPGGQSADAFDAAIEDRLAVQEQRLRKVTGDQAS